METIIELLIPLLAAIAAAGVSWIVAFIKAKTKFEVPASVVTKATELAVEAVGRVEEVAKSQTERMLSETKAGAALSFLDNMAYKYPDVHKYITQKGRDLIEEVLISRLTPDELTPKKNKAE